MTKAEDIKRARVTDLLENPAIKFIRFKGKALMRTKDTHGYKPLTMDNFSEMIYADDLGYSESTIKDLLHAVRLKAPDKTKEYDHFIAFHDRVWDTQKLAFVDDQFDYVYSTDIVLQEAESDGYKAAWQYLCELALGDEELARDYLQAMAPLVMYRRPSGVVWFVGDGANGKSSLINALYRVFEPHFASMTVAAIEDGRDTPRLNGILGNICRESSESRVEDTERYKAIGTHEPFSIHKFHSQDTVDVDTSFHTIFNANNVPVFSDKTKGARRRTLILPFKAHFADDPTFEDRTFTPEFLGGLMMLILEESEIVKENGYRYHWSDATVKAKQAYDSEVNSVEAYINYLLDSKIVGFYNFNLLRSAYEGWCASEGHVPLGITTLKRTVINETGAYSQVVRDGGKVVRRWVFIGVEPNLVTWLDNGYGIKAEFTFQEDEKPKDAVTNKLDEGW